MKTRQQILGQNFLHHKPTIEKILSAAESVLTSTLPKTLVEVGPGKRAITEGLEALCEKYKLSLALVERDLRLKEGLEENINSTITSLHFMDAAKDEFGVLMQNQTAPILFVSNLPYSASSQILAQLCRNVEQLSGAVVMVQKELADRMKAPANTKDRGSFSLMIQSYFSVKVLFDVGPGAFTPAPKVQSSVVELIPLKERFIKTKVEGLKFEQFCKQLFSQRRKMIRKTLADIGLKELEKVFKSENLTGTERPENLDLQTVFHLFEWKQRF
jgi:16S rRNA (adenine1518-N6/adenine1519-N6)-dimethyltransferase